MGCCLGPPRHHPQPYCAPSYGPAVIVSPGVRGPGFHHHGHHHGGFGLHGHGHGHHHGHGRHC